MIPKLSKPGITQFSYSTNRSCWSGITIKNTSYFILKFNCGFRPECLATLNFLRAPDLGQSRACQPRPRGLSSRGGHSNRLCTNTLNSVKSKAYLSDGQAVKALIKVKNFDRAVAGVGLE